MSVFAVKDGDCAVVIHAGVTDSLVLSEGFIRLGAKVRQWSKGYTAIEHPPHGSVGQHHVHVYVKGDQLFALNSDGTAHDKCHGTRIPNYVADKFGLDFPGYALPPGQRIAAALDFDDYYAALKQELSQNGDVETDEVYLLELSNTPESTA